MLSQIPAMQVSPPSVNKPLFSTPKLKLSKGQIITLQGPSGSGKSCFLKTISYLQANKEELPEGVSPEEYRSQVMYVSQAPYFCKNKVIDNLKHPFEWRAHKTHDFPISDCLEYFKIIGWNENRLEQTIDSLSGGEKQIIHLIRALLLNPQVMLLDEPTSSLDMETTQKIESILKNWLSDQSATIIWSTHSEDQAQRLSNTQWIIKNKKLEVCGD